MKVIPLGLQSAVVTSYDQTKTTLQGRVGQRTITDGNGAKVVLGPNPTLAMDVFDDTGAAANAVISVTPNGRVFVGLGITAGVWLVAYYLITTVNGVSTAVWQGNLKLTMTNTGTYTIKGFMVDDTSSASMTLLWATTNTTTTQGGLYGAWGVPIADFAKVSVLTYPVATVGSQSKAIYQLGDNASQASTALTVSDGVGIDTATSNAYVLNGAGATPSIFEFSYTVAPTGTPTTGYTNSPFTLKTGTLVALSGTVLTTNNVQVITPNHTSNAGSKCLTFLTSTTIYTAKISDITNGVTSLPSLTAANLAISADYGIPATITLGQYSSELDKWVLLTVNGAILVKQGINNDTNGKFVGGNSYLKTEIGGTISPVDFGASTAVCLFCSAGFAFIANTAVGQRNVLALDVESDESVLNISTGQLYASLISPVVSGNFSQGVLLSLSYELSKRSVKPTIQFRTSGFSTGPGGGFDATWTTVPKDGDLSSIVNATQVQFRFLFTIMGLETTLAPQMNEAYFAYTDLTQNSDSWVGSVDNSTANAVTPTRTSFRLIKAYATTVPTLFFRSYDDSGNLVVSANTASNPTSFEYTTNNGTSWNSLGTIPNTILTTEIRYNWSSPPGVAVTSSIRES